MLCHRKAGGDIHGECCGKNVKTIQLVTGILEEDVIYSSFSSEVYNVKCNRSHFWGARKLEN